MFSDSIVVSYTVLNNPGKALTAYATHDPDVINDFSGLNVLQTGTITIPGASAFGAGLKVGSQHTDNYIPTYGIVYAAHGVAPSLE